MCSIAATGSIAGGNFLPKPYSKRMFPFTKIIVNHFAGLQIPNYKLQITNKFQFSITNDQNGVDDFIPDMRFV